MKSESHHLVKFWPTDVEFEKLPLYFIICLLQIISFTNKIIRIKILFLVCKGKDEILIFMVVSIDIKMKCRQLNNSFSCQNIFKFTITHHLLKKSVLEARFLSFPWIGTTLVSPELFNFETICCEFELKNWSVLYDNYWDWNIVVSI